MSSEIIKLSSDHCTPEDVLKRALDLIDKEGNLEGYRDIAIISLNKASGRFDTRILDTNMRCSDLITVCAVVQADMIAYMTGRGIDDE